MKVASLFSGGKDSVYSAYLESKEHELVCLITLHSENKDSYMFHTPSISKTERQAEVMNLPLVIASTPGEKEEELVDLKEVIKKVKEEYRIEGIVTGALHSVYQAERIGKICDDLDLKCLNPLWHKDEISYLNELLENKFKVIVTAVRAFPLDSSWIGREINEEFISEVEKLKEKYKIHPAGEGGEFETFVLNCPLFSEELKVKNIETKKMGEHSFVSEIELE